MLPNDNVHYIFLTFQAQGSLKMALVYWLLRLLLGCQTAEVRLLKQWI